MEEHTYERRGLFDGLRVPFDPNMWLLAIGFVAATNLFTWVIPRLTGDRLGTGDDAPYRDVLGGLWAWIASFGKSDPGFNYGTWVLSAVGLVALWAFFSAAINRIAAMTIARQESVPIKEACAFSARKFLPVTFTVGLVVLVFAVLYGVANPLYGLVSRVPVLDVLLSVFFYPLVLLSSFLVVFVVFLGVFGFNLASSAMAHAGAADLGLGEFDTLALSGVNADGHPALKAHIARRYGVAPEQVFCACGTSLANFVALAALLEPGARVLLEQPVYEPLERVLEGLGARITALARPAAARFQPDLDAIERGFRAGARLLVLTDLHNPSAARLDPALREAIARLAEHHGAWVLIDEVYLDGVFASRPPSAIAVSPRMIVTASLTKTWGLGMLRAGWALAPAALVRRFWEINDHLGVESCYVADLLAIRAFERLPALERRARERRSACLPLVRRFAERHRLRWHEPAGGFIAWLGLPPGMRAMALCTHARNRYDTQVTPGDFFGVPDHIRLGFGAEPDTVAEGLRRLGCAIEELRRRPSPPA